MGTARVVWKDLCLDVVDREAGAAFWAPTLGLTPEVSERNVSLDGETPRHRVWLNVVDRPHTVKNRLHLDLDGSVDDLLARGASVLSPASENGGRWTVMADPEGNEFCAFARDEPRRPGSDYRLHGVVVDCADTSLVAHWWGMRFGVEPVYYEEYEGWTLEGVAVDEEFTLDFGPVPEPRTVPNRVHWDVYGDVEELLGVGATYLWEGEAWHTLADPEGNEFCVFG
ncbi:VOC family protein [Nocardioides acrostichi]|uniref:Glyoxalase-like domain-containing protein n=1 Tax=Nocardioides acrostichi TaxID=2784339 RepID=A0A930Y7V2_9ACTN|nr:VOC family protein [Nocardioides acrostichi]MBF4162381.1 hypothetical protein [Nocardioides acrostichi]